ncbi:hypothetical protein CLV92_101583 [Kineococcus xinjiangensis]|uniref:Transglycosylase-like protein with SLT domain n=1 Tax=Kineococcus xinjiangensis TaxID=512762 RepID=A0A2S6IWZ3_9ACTN|nr:hypothetical protein [Kineococcus xinjiangensis]PPK98882.1 hypothetical protein CLV92_101583 [Kineococcus xinjiangensis]
MPVLLAFAAVGLVGAATPGGQTGGVRLAGQAGSADHRVDPEVAQAQRDEAHRVAVIVEQQYRAAEAWSQGTRDRQVRAAVLAEQARLAEEARRAEEEARRLEAERLAEEARRAEAEEATRNAVRDPRGAARVLVAQHGWGEEQFSCLDSLWMKESGWNPAADNPTSSAYGIPQALPGRKMASAGADWETNPLTQIRWGLGYIEGRYGSPCAAWAHSRSHNWY